MHTVTSFQTVLHGKGKSEFVVEEPDKYYLSQISKVKVNTDVIVNSIFPLDENVTLAL